MNTKLVESLVNAVSSLEAEDYKLFKSLLADKALESVNETVNEVHFPASIQKDWRLQDYLAMTKVYEPRASGDQTLFTVRVPDDCETLSQSEYTDLIKLRVMWMMQDWLKYENDDREKLQSLMATGLLKIHPGQIEPLLSNYYDDDDDDDDDEYDFFEDWASAWSNCLIEGDSRWKEWFYVINSDVCFPLELTPECFTSMDNHDELTIEYFVEYLMSPFE